VTLKCRANPDTRALSRLEVIAAPLAFALAIAAALALVSCGGDEDAQLLPGATAREITENLDTVEQLADEGECLGAEAAAEEVGAQVEALQSVDAELVRALERGAARLNEVLATCEEAPSEEVPPVTTIPDTSEKDEEKEQKKEEKEREKEEEEAEKEEEREEEEETETTGPPEEVPPPHSNGQGQGPGGGSGEGSSGGISPSNEVGEGD
jgi:outer membrane biosynthesis protein TonB